MKYDLRKNEYRNWILAENAFDSEHLAKYESLMATGNGYLGLRSSLEESYAEETRNLFVAGTFNKAFSNEVTELPNAADVTNIKIILNGENFSLISGKIISYERYLNIKNAELVRNVHWISPKGNEYELVFKRFVSMDDKHLLCQKIIIIPKTEDAQIKIVSGIDGTVSNSGSQHFIEGEKRFYDSKYIHSVTITNESGITFIQNTANSFNVKENKKTIDIKRRKIYQKFNFSVAKDSELVIEKVSNIYTTRDIWYMDNSIEEIKDMSLDKIKKSADYGYEKLFDKHKKCWSDIWYRIGIEIESENEFDVLSLRFALYHLVIMTPSHDARMNIGAKGLTGEGYKGHTFWDTELYCLHFWLYSNPENARKLLEYRYHSLKGAHKKAEQNGYEGAMFPWESAWLDDGEVTPLIGGANVVTGEVEKVWTGIKEIHISADIAYSVHHYYTITGDEKFMEQYGYELIFDTAIFWQSRLEYIQDKDRYEITDVIGPDEYKEHVDNNAFTNYMAWWNIKKAIKYYDEIKVTNEGLFNRLNEKLNINKYFKLWIDKSEKIYLPKTNENGVIPQDDTYLSLPELDLTKYKEGNALSIYKNYNMEQINSMQISKQADLMNLFFIHENMFDLDTKMANFDYYEKRCLHDSSLSYSMYSILAKEVGKMNESYDLYRKACLIDLGPNMHSSDEGIHAASQAGMWQCVVQGFGGVKMVDSKLQINPSLPEKWRRLKFRIHYLGSEIEIEIDDSQFRVEKITNDNNIIEFIHQERLYRLNNNVIMRKKETLQ